MLRVVGRLLTDVSKVRTAIIFILDFLSLKIRKDNPSKRPDLRATRHDVTFRETRDFCNATGRTTKVAKLIRIIFILWKRKVHTRLHNSSPMVHNTAYTIPPVVCILKHINQVHILTSHISRCI